MTERQVEIVAEDLAKQFGLRKIFAGIGFSVTNGQRLGITGRNGSGKSTLMKIIGGVAEQSAGTVRYTVDGKRLNDGRHTVEMGFVSPYLQLYTEFTAWEHAELVQNLRGLRFERDQALSLFERFGLERRIHDELRTYSSGMLQRVKYICALIHDPSYILLDEPMTNLDEQGMQVVQQIIMERTARSVVLIATNDVVDLQIATHLLSVEHADFRPRQESSVAAN